MINNRPPQNQAEFGSGVNLAPPSPSAKDIEGLRVLARQEGLGCAVASLLFQIIRDRRATVMPNESRRTESELAAALLQSPADINVIACLFKLWIKTAGFLQGPFMKSHVAARNVLGQTIGQHDV